MRSSTQRSIRLRAEEFAEVDRIARERDLPWSRALRLIIRSHPEIKLNPSILIKHGIT